MTGAPLPLPRIPSGQWGYHLPLKPIFVKVRGRWLVMGIDEEMPEGARVWVQRRHKPPVLAAIGAPMAEHLHNGTRFVACEFENIGPRGCYGNE